MNAFHAPFDPRFQLESEEPARLRRSSIRRDIHLALRRIDALAARLRQR
ncbi:hypothetical protein [Pseudomonas subflava]|nr:hypothetical protein [Pseudomonas subflava]